ncbi:hypothetical protein ZWY2020_025770 [Hordeum vulgare]|nr:hypothetical protein ZWY2020_025770 [Hordeum vulgare]
MESPRMWHACCLLYSASTARSAGARGRCVHTATHGYRATPPPALIPRLASDVPPPVAISEPPCSPSSSLNVMRPARPPRTGSLPTWLYLDHDHADIMLNLDKLGKVDRARTRCYAMAPARSMSLNLAVRYTDVINSVVLHVSRV